ncbi:hypothetical protein CPB85DRAFT_1440570 [Mucidula mucida]|nr:hypothetical protein CPB85DRAFT_1440570 [Mucidula mucida]
MSPDEAFDVLVADALTAQIYNHAHCEFQDLALNGCRPALQFRQHLPEEVQYLTMPRNPYPVDVYEPGAERTRDATAYQMGVRETEQFARANETAADFRLNAPFPGFDLAWGPVFLALILDRRVHFLPSPRLPGGVRILLASGDERTSCTPQCDFGAQQTGIFIIAGMVDLDIHSEDINYRSLLVNNSIMKLARLLDPAQGGNLQSMNAFIHSDKSMHISIFFSPENCRT